MHQSVATIDSPKFLNLQPLDINPLMSKCEIKVLYVGLNRNRTFITQEVATEIGKTLRGAPIVGYYKREKEDFVDHGEKVIIDDEGIKFECQTTPYGFVSPDAEVWFQDFEDYDDATGEAVVHKYLMTTGYLWTDQFPEASLAVEEGRPQSMEFNEKSFKGNWTTNYEKRMNFFIINDAIIQKICILGDDVEPCFEGASVTAPDVSTQFTLDNNFKHTLYSMMQDLKNALNKGGQQMDNLENNAVELDAGVTESAQEAPKVEAAAEDTLSAPVDYVKKEEEKEEKQSNENEAGSGNSNDGNQENKKTDEENKEEEEKKDKASKKYELLEEELNTLKNSYSLLKSQYEELVSFKREIENQKKDALISEFYMLADEDKRDVIQNKEKYTLDEIKAKLSVICFDKKVNFTLNEDNQTEQMDKQENMTTYALNSYDDCNNLPEWVRAVKEQEKLGY